MVKAVVFYFHGTIANSFDKSFKVIKKLALKHNLGEIIQADMNSFRNMGALELINKFKVPVWKIPTLIKEARREFKK